VSRVGKWLFDYPHPMVLFVVAELLWIVALAYAFAGSRLAWAYGAIAVQVALAWSRAIREPK
jgi:hypothetical protein